MKCYENEIALRRVLNGSSGSLNGYHIHAKLESLMVDSCQVKTPYVFNVGRDKSSKLTVAYRTSEPTHLPGEQEQTLSFEKGQSVAFVVRVLPYVNKTPKPGARGRREFIRDPMDRELRLLTLLERAGLDAESCEELEQTTTNFTKPQGTPFKLRDVKFLVEATVTDPVAFEKAYVGGVGPKANFGYGMIQLIKV